MWLAGISLNLGLAVPSRGQTANPLELLEIILTFRDSLDSTYIRSFKHKFSPRLQYSRRVVNFGFRPGSGNADNLRFYPNTNSSIGLGLYYSTFAFGWTISLDNDSPQRVASYGKTKYLDLSFSSYQARFGVDLYFQRYQGFFSAKPAGLSYPNLRSEDNPYPQRPDLKIVSTGINFFHIQNPARFSMQAPFLLVRKQIKSAGSFLYMLGANYMGIDADSNITAPFSDNRLPIFDDKPAAFASFSRGNFVTLHLAPGYGYSLVHKSLFLTGTVFAGPGLQYQILHNDVEDNFAVCPLIKFNTRVGAGYNGDRFFSSVILTYDVSRNVWNGLRLHSANSLYLIQAGYRF